MTEVPVEQVAQQPEVPVPPLIDWSQSTRSTSHYFIDSKQLEYREYIEGYIKTDETRRRR
eukprot:3851361-Amphidinium_carterae.1